MTEQVPKTLQKIVNEIPDIVLTATELEDEIWREHEPIVGRKVECSTMGRVKVDGILIK